MLKIINLTTKKSIKFKQLSDKLDANNKTGRTKLNYKLLSNEVVEVGDDKYQRRRF